MQWDYQCVRAPFPHPVRLRRPTLSPGERVRPYQPAGGGDGELRLVVRRARQQRQRSPRLGGELQAARGGEVQTAAVGDHRRHRPAAQRQIDRP